MLPPWKGWEQRMAERKERGQGRKTRQDQQGSLRKLSPALTNASPALTPVAGQLDAFPTLCSHLSAFVGSEP